MNKQIFDLFLAVKTIFFWPGWVMVEAVYCLKLSMNEKVVLEVQKSLSQSSSILQGPKGDRGDKGDTVNIIF